MIIYVCGEEKDVWLDGLVKYLKFDSFCHIRKKSN